MSCYFCFFFYCQSDLSCGECNLIYMDLFNLCVACLTVFVNCLEKQFAIVLAVVVECYGNVECVWRCSVR